MKNLHAKLKNHGKKIIIHLKRHHRKYLFGALCSGILALIGLHTANTINSTFADDARHTPNNTPIITYNSDAKITYIDTNGKEFTDIGTITISDGTNSITMLDRNLGAETNDTENTGSYGYHFQWGNNFGFEIGCVESYCTDYITDNSKNWNDAVVDTRDYGPGKYYIGDIFITDRDNENKGDWSIEINDNLWGGEKDNMDNQRGLDLDYQSTRQGPCPDGYHIPSIGEWNKLLELWLPIAEQLGNIEKNYSEDNLFYILSENDGVRINFQKDFKIPPAGYRSLYNGAIVDIGIATQLWSSSPNSDKITEWGPSPHNARYFSLDKYGITSHHSTPRANAFSLRCFKNIPPTCNIEYSTTGLTNQNVTATLTGCNEEITVTNNSGIEYTFENTGTFTFQFQDLAGNTGETTATVDRIDKVRPSCNDIDYNTTGLTNQNVTATLTGCNEEISVTNNSGIEYTFENTGTFTFQFQDLAGNTGETTATVDRIDKVRPSCNVEYSTTGATTGNVVASLTGCSETITGTNLQHTFTGNGTYTFRFQDLAGNTGNTEAEVTWISNNPACNVKYNTTGFTNKPVLAYLTGCNKSITGTDLQYTFTGNGEYTFEFQDLLGNTGSTRATVTWITDNTTYINVEGDEFRWNDLSICNPDNSRECITMMDRNLGATTNDITKTGSYGYKYQWGNNYGFKDGCWQTTGCSDDVTSGALSVYTNGVEWRNIYNNSGYYGKVFIKGGLNSYWSDYKVHNYLWGGGNDNSGSNWGYPVSNPTDRQGPCPDGYHVPSAGERSNVIGRWIEKSNTGLRAQGYKDTVLSSRFLNWISDHSGSYAFLVNFNIPLAGARDYYSGKLGEFGDNTYLWTSTAPGNETAVFAYRFGKYNVEPWNHYSSSDALPVRCFKNNTGYNSVDAGITFSISVDDNISSGKYVNFTIKVIKNGLTYKNYTNKIMIVLTDKRGNLIDDNLYDVYNNGIYEFTQSDRGRKTFTNRLKIKKEGTYKLKVFDLNNHEGSEIIVVGGSHNAANFEYDTLKFNPNYSDEMNKAYQFSRYFKITTKNSIKDANMYGGLNRVAMAKMLTNYAENVLGIDDFDTNRNCTFKDVSVALDKEYNNGVTKACQLGIMGVNAKDNNFNPYGTVTRAQFATALSRLLYGTKDGTDNYYSTHISKLYREGIITKTDPTLKELRGYVMLMLMRAGK